MKLRLWIYKVGTELGLKLFKAKIIDIQSWD